MFAHSLFLFMNETGAGYDLTPIAGYDLSVQQASGNTVYNWYLHPCGPLSTWFTLACQGSNTMFCQESNSTRTAYSLATWNGSIAETATWSAAICFMRSNHLCLWLHMLTYIINCCLIDSGWLSQMVYNCQLSHVIACCTLLNLATHLII